MALDRLTKVDGGGISTTSDYRVGIITASKFVGPFDGTGGNFSGVVTATNGVFSGNISAVDGNFSGNVTIGGTLTYEDVTNIDSVGIITAQSDIHVGGGVSAVGVGTFGGLDINGNVDISGDLDVDGHTNLDNVSIAGVTTITNTYGYLYLEGLAPSVYFKDTSSGTPTFRLMGEGGQLYVQNTTNPSNSLIINTATKQATFGGGVDVDGDLDVDGHTNLDNVSIAGVSTFNDIIRAYGSYVTFQGNSYNAFWEASSNALRFVDNANAYFGTANDLKIYHNGSHSYLDGSGGTGNVVVKTGSNAFVTNSGSFFLKTGNNADSLINGIAGGAVNIYFNANKKFETTNTGVSINGTIVAAGADINGDLDVDGHTNLDNVSVAGVTTFTNNVHLLDNDELRIGGSNGSHDGMKLYHDGSNSYINDTGTGSLILDGNSIIRLRLNGTTKFQTDSSGVTASGTSHLFTSGTSGDCELIIEADSDNNNELDNPRILFRQDGGNDWSAIGTNDNVLEISNSVGSGGILFKTGGTNGYTNATGRWKIDTNGHLLPNTAGAVNIGSASAEIGNVYLADDKQVLLGNSQDLKIFHDSSATNNVISGHTGSLNLRNYDTNSTDINLSTRNDILLQTAINESAIWCDANAGVHLYYNGAQKLVTASTGIDVTGEVAASQDYPNFRPTLDFNFAATKKLDPRITYYRTGPASYHDEFGKVVIVGENVPRFDHTFPEYWDEGNLGDSNSRGISKGLLMEPTRTNLYKNNHNLTTTNDHGSITQTVNTTETTAPDGTLTATKIAVTGSDQWSRWDGNNGLDLVGVNFTDTFSTSIYMKTVGTSNVNVAMDFGDNGTKTFSVGQEWKRYAISNVHHNYGGSTKFIDIIFSGSVYIWGLQCENGTHPTSYIPTSGTTATRGNEYAVIDGEDFTDFYNPVESSVLAVGTIHRPIAAQGQLNIFHIGDDNEDGHGVFREHGTKDVWYHIRNGNSTPSGGNLNPSGFGDWDENEEARIAIAFKDGDQAISVNGGNQVTATVTSNYPTANITKMWIGSHGTGSYFEGTISRIAYYPKQLTDNQLNTLTA